MAEWTNATVLKTVIPQGIVGSNPTPSARYYSNNVLETLDGNPDSPQAVVFLTSIIDVIDGFCATYVHTLVPSCKTAIRLVGVARNQAPMAFRPDF